MPGSYVKECGGNDRLVRITVEDVESKTSVTLIVPWRLGSDHRIDALDVLQARIAVQPRDALNYRPIIKVP